MTLQYKIASICFLIIIAYNVINSDDAKIIGVHRHLRQNSTSTSSINLVLRSHKYTNYNYYTDVITQKYNNCSDLILEDSVGEQCIKLNDYDYDTVNYDIYEVVKCNDVIVTNLYGYVVDDIEYITYYTTTTCNCSKDNYEKCLTEALIDSKKKVDFILYNYFIPSIHYIPTNGQ